MIRAFVLYDEAPDPERYAQHVELCQNVPGATFRHGKVTGAAVGDPRHAYYAEFEWPDEESFKQGVRSPEFMESGKDAMAMGGRFTVHFANVE